MGRPQLPEVIDGPEIACVHSFLHRLSTPLLMRSSKALALRCRPVRKTPIYEQLRGERINADVPPSETALPRVDRRGRHRLGPDTTGPGAVYAPPGPGPDLVAHQHPVPGIADQPPGGPQRTAARRGPRTPLPRPAHAQQAPARAARMPSTATGTEDPAEAARGTSADSKRVVRPRQDQRTDCAPAATPQGEFPWFEADDDSRDQLSR